MTDTASGHPILELRGIKKSFPGVLANDDISLDVKRGEVHALLGENGAGKTTLMNIIYGLMKPDKGEIVVRGAVCHMESPGEAIALGIGMVHQHFMLVPALTVTENIILGNEPVKAGFLKRDEAKKKITELSTAYCLNIHPDMKVEDLSVGEQQRVEILRALYRGAEILILDEPTASLTPNECISFFEILRTMIESGKSIIFISHKLDEVLKISDRITILRKGRVTGSVLAAETTQTELAGLMVGRDVVLGVEGKHQLHTNPDPRASLKNIEVREAGDKPLLHGIDLEMFDGEILGVAGVDGNGQTELAEVIAGLRIAEKGKIFISGEDVTGTSPSDRRDRGVYYIPAERKLRGCAQPLSLTMNFILKNHGSTPFSRKGILNYEEINRFADTRIAEYDIRCSSREVAAGTLSGGNLQKLILAREISAEPALLVAEQPTRGLDVGAIENIHKILLRERERGCAVILISADLDEVIALSDRVIVMYEGSVVFSCDTPENSRKEIGLAMGGAYCITE